MKARHLVILSAVTVIVVIGAIVLMMAQEERHRGPRAGQLLFPDLTERLNDIRQVDIALADRKTTLLYSDKGWIIREKDGYPANESKIRNLALEIAGAELIEAKTANPALFENLGLRGIEDPDSNAAQVTLKTADGKPLASVLVGHSQAGAPGQPRWTFVRKPDDDQTWLVSGLSPIDGAAVDWARAELVSISRSRIRRVDIIHPDGQHLTILRQSPQQQDFDLQEVSPGRKLTGRSAVNTVAGAVGHVVFDDVAKDADIDFSDAVVTRFLTFDGLTLSAETVTDGDESWVRFAAAWHADDVASAENGEAMVLSDAPEDGADEAQAINNRVDRWAYAIPAYKVEDLTPRRDDLTEPAGDDGEDNE